MGGDIEPSLLGPAREYRIGSNFCKFSLIKTSFTLSEQVYLMKVLRLFNLK